MNPIKCELCGSTDVIKTGEYYVCQHCGTKYTVEAAKKLLGTVRIDNSERLDNLRRLARRAKEDYDSITGSQYYSQILLEDPNDWEAYFYSTFFDAQNIKIAQIGQSATRVSNMLGTTFQLIIDNIQDESEWVGAYCEVADKVIRFSTNLFENIAANLSHTDIEGNNKFIEKNYVPCLSMLVVLADELYAKFGTADTSLDIYDAAQRRMSDHLKNIFLV